MICPHCGNEIQNVGTKGPADVVPIYVNLNNNGCNPAPAVTIIPFGQPWANTVCAAPVAQPIITTFIKF